ITGLRLEQVWGVRRNGAPIREVLSLRLFSPGLLLYMLLMALSGSVLVAEMGNWMEKILPVPQAIQDVFLQILSAKNLPEFVQRAMLLSVMAPLTEEPLFRGVFQYGLVRNYGPVRGVLAAAVCFGVFHLIPWQAAGATLIGLLIGIVVYRTGSLFAGIVMHAIWNLLPLLVISLLGNQAIEGFGVNKEEVRHIPVGVLLMNAGIFMLAFRGFWHRTKDLGGEKEEEQVSIDL
ncbi:MAG: CPBP family intramembrane metalloprotease, partial [bacterium]|nr:CPBP family intramembrane metalloprotease [bacterium]